jgi:transcriptional regulator with XRE-family HTH domain
LRTVISRTGPSEEEHVGDRAAAVVRDARAQLGLSQRAFAERVGVAPARISEYETGKRDPGLDTLDRIARAAGLQLAVAVVPRSPAEERQRSLLELAARSAERSMAIEGKPVAPDRPVSMGDGTALMRRILAHSR